jgi:DNA-binding response OmpR family regulator
MNEFINHKLPGESKGILKKALSIVLQKIGSFRFMKLLIIEDEKELAESMVSYLKNENYSCEVAFNFKQALDKIETSDYECIALDITLPGGSGMQLLKELKNNKKTDGVIIISAKNSIDDRISGLRLGADDYLVKPFHLSELAARSMPLSAEKYTTEIILSFQRNLYRYSCKEVMVSNDLLN